LHGALGKFDSSPRLCGITRYLNMENKMELTFDNQPNWLPLENFSEKYPNQINCCDFMHMGRVGGINLYKNRVSRGYINIDSEGYCYAYCSGTYLQINDESAIRRQS